MNAGRIMTDLRSLNISDFGIVLSEPAECHTDGLTVTKCLVCGAVSWEPYTVTVTAIEPLPQPDSNGEYFPALATVKLPVRAAKHSKSCPNK